MKGLMLSKDYLDVRAGRIAYAMSDHGIAHDGVCFRLPPQYRDAYANLTADPYMGYAGVRRAVEVSDADVIHVHCELSGFWLVHAAKEAADGRPVIANIHDLTIARPHAVFDPYEPSAIREADALVWVSEAYRDYAVKAYGAWESKPECFITNYVSSRSVPNRLVLPHVGGVCVVGGVAKRGEVSDRDLSAVSDVLGGQLHIYGGGHEADYGINHPPETVHQVLMQRIGSHDWGFAGTPTKVDSWEVTLATRVTEYIAAGVPGIYLNHPLAKPFAEAGLGIYCKNLHDVRVAASTDPKPYAKACAEAKNRYTTEAIIEPLVEMYGALC